MKRLFCTVATDVTGELDSPIIFHIRAETMDKAEECANGLLREHAFHGKAVEDIFDTFTFEVTEEDITEA
jgi:hypothetical protein